MPGLTWGVLWWYVCWRKGIDARGIPLWLGLGIALGGELGYGQYVSWIQGNFNVANEVISIASWIGYAWFAICGIGWAAPGGIALGWALTGRQTLGVWLSRLLIPLGAALLTRIAVQVWPWLFFPKWNLGLYVTVAGGANNADAAANKQWMMLATWTACALLSLFACLFTAKVTLPIWVSRGIRLSAVGIVSLLLLPLAQWLFFPGDELGLFAGQLGRHLGRTVYTNSQNAIVVGWWIGALLVAALQRDRYTLFAGFVLGAGFGVGFPLSATWCLGYSYDPKLVDWWKLWELNSGFNLGILYVAVLYWALPQVEENHTKIPTPVDSTYQKWCETLATALGVALLVHIITRDYLFTAGIFLAVVYVVPMLLTALLKEPPLGRQRGISYVYSLLLLIFILAWGVSSQAGIVLGLYDARAADQYAWPPARKVLFTPFGVLIVAAGLCKLWQAVRSPKIALPPYSAAPRISAQMVDLITFTGVVGALSIWPTKIGVCYAICTFVVLFAFNRLNNDFDHILLDD